MNKSLLKMHRDNSNLFLGEINLSPYASWNRNGITVAGWANGTGGSSLSQLSRPFGLSITTNDVLYISDTENHRIIVLLLNENEEKFIIGPISDSDVSQFRYPRDLFTTNTSLYVLDYNNHRLQKLSLNGTDATTVPGLNRLDWPEYFYVDENMNIYLSDKLVHRVLLFHSNSTDFTIVAGIGVKGSNNSQLNTPYGVFADRNGTIYIADHFNHRIMKWSSGAVSGIRVAGDGTTGSSSAQIDFPTQILVDTNGYMYISDAGKHQITRWAPDSTFGVCIAGCTESFGTGSTQLKAPHSLAFDSNGSLYVSEYANHRVQKFQILHHVGK